MGAALTIPISASADPPHYRIIVVEPLDPQLEVVSYDLRGGINNLGEMVTTAFVSGSAFGHPFVWLPTANYGLSAGTQPLPAEPEGTNFFANDININGFVVGSGTVGTLSTGAVVWDLNAGEGYQLELSEGIKNQAYAINDASPPVIVGHEWISQQPIIDRGFRKELGGTVEILGPADESHNTGAANAISDSGLAVGYSFDSLCTPPGCGQEQDCHFATAWPATETDADILNSLWFPDAIAVAEGVNNASPSMIVGYGEDPGDPTLPCRERALFWESPTANPVALPFLTDGNGTPIVDFAMRANALADPFTDETIRVVGRSFAVNAAVQWQFDNGAWEAIDLNGAVTCDGDAWSNLSHAIDINDNGWISGIGTVQGNKPRAFVLVPLDHCPGDMVGSQVSYPDGKVNITDLLYMLSVWGTDECIADLDGNGSVGISDLLALLGNWGGCPGYPVQSVATLSEELDEVGLSQADWDDFMDIMETGSSSEQKNWNCWMQRYLSKCDPCRSCPGSDPFSN